MPDKSSKLTVMIGGGWTMTLERGPGYGPVNDKLVVEAFAIVGRLLNQSLVKERLKT